MRPIEREANVVKNRFFTTRKKIKNFMPPIASSELIITPKGTIYHLDLAPHQLAHTIITVGDPDRVGEVSKYFDSVTHKAKHREFVTHTGFVGKKNISVVSTGIGPDNIDIVLNELDALVNIDFETRLPKEQLTSLSIIRLGTSGALQADVAIDSLVASSLGLGLDNLMHYYQYPAINNDLLEAFILHTHLNNSPIIPYLAPSSQKLLSHFNDGYTKGITVTCPGFYGPQGRVLRASIAQPELINRLSSFKFTQHRITNFEMETSAIYGLGALLGHQCLSISTIVANRVLQTFSKDGQASVDNMIKTSLEIIEKI